MFLHSPTHQPLSHMCWICGKAVDIQNCKTDEHGSIVHKPCLLNLLLYFQEPFDPHAR